MMCFLSSSNFVKCSLQKSHLCELETPDLTPKAFIFCEIDPEMRKNVFACFANERFSHVL